MFVVHWRRNNKSFKNENKNNFQLRNGKKMNRFVYKKILFFLTEQLNLVVNGRHDKSKKINHLFIRIKNKNINQILNQKTQN